MNSKRDKIICLKTFSIECGLTIHSWTKDRQYTVLNVDIEGCLVQAEWSDYWFENEEWFEHCGYESYEKNFISLKELRKQKLNELL